MLLEIVGGFVLGVIFTCLALVIGFYVFLLRKIQKNENWIKAHEAATAKKLNSEGEIQEEFVRKPSQTNSQTSLSSNVIEKVELQTQFSLLYFQF